RFESRLVGTGEEQVTVFGGDAVPCRDVGSKRAGFRLRMLLLKLSKLLLDGLRAVRLRLQVVVVRVLLLDAVHAFLHDAVHFRLLLGREQARLLVRLRLTATLTLNGCEVAQERSMPSGRETGAERHPSVHQWFHPF